MYDCSLFAQVMVEFTSEGRKNGSFDVTVIVAPGDESELFEAVTSKLFLGMPTRLVKCIHSHGIDKVSKYATCTRETMTDFPGPTIVSGRQPPRIRMLLNCSGVIIVLGEFEMTRSSSNPHCTAVTLSVSMWCFHSC